MKTANKFIFCNRWANCLGAALTISILTGCPDKTALPPPAPAAAVAPQVVQAPQVIVQQPPTVVESGFVYYPDYEVYYDPGTRVYWSNRDGRWVSAPEPFGISADILLRAPSVQLDFRDSPDRHHADVVRHYPHGWQAGRR